jgi:hypothetical protein
MLGAYTAIPAILGGNVIISVGSGTYTGTSTLGGRTYKGAYSITIQGSTTLGANRTITANSTYSATALRTITYIQAGVTVNSLVGKIIKFTSGTMNNTYRVITANTASDGSNNVVLTLAGMVTTAITNGVDTFSFYTLGSIFSGGVGAATQTYSQPNLNVNDISYEPTTANYCATINAGSVNFTRCQLNSTYCLNISNTGVVNLETCGLIHSADYGVFVGGPNVLNIFNSLIHYVGPSLGRNIMATINASLTPRSNSVFQGTSTTKVAYGFLVMGGTALDTRSQIFINNCEVGIRYISGSSLYSSTEVLPVYTNCTTNTQTT